MGWLDTLKDAGATAYAEAGPRPIRLDKPRIHNEDGSISTERTITVESDGKHYVIPTIVDGKPHEPDEAVELWAKGKNEPVGVFHTADAANRYAEWRTNAIGSTLAAEQVASAAPSFRALSDRRSKSMVPISDIWPLLRAAFERR